MHMTKRKGDLFDSFLCLNSTCVTVIFLAELPPPYTAIASPDAVGIPVINCRVCQSLISLDSKLHQHVVKCTVCNEATVSGVSTSKSIDWYLTSSPSRKYFNSVT